MKEEREGARERILEAAKEEFLADGYARASMRTIAAQAGMTVGNIYLYFSSKEKLFEAIVGDALDAIRALLATEVGGEVLKRLVEGLRDVFIQRRTEFLLLLTRAEGSRFAGLKEIVISAAERRFGEALGTDDPLCGALAVAIIEGLVCLFNREDGDEETLTKDLYRFLNYMLQGLLDLGETEGVCTR